MSTESVAKRIADVQMELLGMKIPKSGYNPFNKNDYHELSDLFPPVLKACYKRGLFLKFDFTDSQAMLYVCDMNNIEDYIKYTVPMPTIKELNKKMNIMQSEGSFITYLRRYLLMTAFHIQEEDVAEAITLDDEESKPLIKDKAAKPKSDKPEVISKAIAELKKEGVKINKAILFSKCNKIGIPDNERQQVIDWIGKNCKE